MDWDEWDLLVTRIPGMVDLSKPPFRQHISVFCSEGEEPLILGDNKVLEGRIRVEDGLWLPYSDFKEGSKVNNEMVGFPQTSLEGIFPQVYI
jgi:hypothetical protein